MSQQIKDLEKLVEIKDRIIAALEKEISVLKANQNPWRPLNPFWYGSGTTAVTNCADSSTSLNGNALTGLAMSDEPCCAPV